MRALLERSRSARAAVVLTAFGAVLALVHAAEAGGDFGFRREMLWPELRFTPEPVQAPAVEPVRRHRHARRIWAASRSRPLRVTLARGPHRGRAAGSAAAHPRSTTARAQVARAWVARPPTARVAGLAAPQAVFPVPIVLPKPQRPALVSIYQDHTLRDGDAVMMADGVHVFRGLGRWPHRPGDFVRLTFATALDWRLRRTLDAFDRNPPTRWSATESAAG